MIMKDIINNLIMNSISKILYNELRRVIFCEKICILRE